MAGNTCECVRWASHISYTDDELRNTGACRSSAHVGASRAASMPRTPLSAIAGMRSLEEMAAESMAAFTAAQAGGATVAGAAEGDIAMGGTAGGGSAPGGGMDLDDDAAMCGRDEDAGAAPSRCACACRGVVAHRGGGAGGVDVVSHAHTTCGDHACSSAAGGGAAGTGARRHEGCVAAELHAAAATWGDGGASALPSSSGGEPRPTWARVVRPPATATTSVLGAAFGADDSSGVLCRLCGGRG